VTRLRLPVTGQRSPVTDSRLGLTLVEVILAIAILGLGIAGMVAAAAKCLAVARQARNYETAREALARVELKYPVELEEKIMDAADSGTLDRPYDGYSWRREVEEVGLEEDTLFKITTTIAWSDSGRNSEETIVTFVYRPGEKLPGTAVK
jgi:hypothetical protein